MADQLRLHLRPEHRRILEALLREHLPGVEVWAYGSRVTGRSHDGSDLDLVLRGPGLEEIPISRLGDFEEAVRESTIPFLVEARDWARLPERFHQEIERDYVVMNDSSAPEPERRDSTKGAEWYSYRRLSYGRATSSTVRLGDVADLLTGFPFKSEHYVTDSEAPRLLRGDNVAQGRLRWHGAKRWSAAAATAMEQFWLREGDVVLAMDRPWIEAGLKFASVRRSDLPTLLVQRVARLRGGKDLDTRFLKYVIACQDFSDYVLSVQTGTAVPHISSRQIENYEFYLPPLRQQRAIAHILGTLDDKIELNRRMNATLEAMVRAIFKDWFVDFGPTRAKMAGRDTGLPEYIADLFPDRLVDSELGEIPDGWAVGHMEDGFEIIMGQSPPGHTYNDIGDGLPFFQGRSDFGFRYPRNRKFCTAPNRIAEPWDTIVSVRAPVGDINMAWERCCIGRGVAALRPRSGAVSYAYCATQALQSHMREYEHTGTVFGAINRKQLARLPLQQPALDVIHAFEQLVHPLDQTIRTRTAEGDTLTALRDVLLPKLVSGDVRLGKAASEWRPHARG